MASRRPLSKFVCSRCGVAVHLNGRSWWRHYRTWNSQRKACDELPSPILRTLWDEDEKRWVDRRKEQH